MAEIGVDYELVSTTAEGFAWTGENREPQVGEFFYSNPNFILRKLTDEPLTNGGTSVRFIARKVAVSDEENKPDGPTNDGIVYVPQWYVSDESLISPYASTPDEDKWSGVLTEPQSRMNAIAQARFWASADGSAGTYKTSRVVRVDPDNDFQIVEIVWLSMWERQEAMSAGASAGAPGESLKMIVWAPRDWHHPDHWGWFDMMDNIGLGANQWDLIYARVVDKRGKEVCYSIRFNTWDADNDPVMEWDWSEILNLPPNYIELVRATPIEPRSFPDGVPTVKCVYCEKKIEQASAWEAHNPDTDHLGPYCCCWCADQKNEDDGRGYRCTPDGIEQEEPGCTVVREQLNAV